MQADTESKVFCFAVEKEVRAVYLWQQKQYYKLGSIHFLRCYWHFFNFFFHLANCSVFLWSLKVFFFRGYFETNRTIELKFRRLNSSLWVPQMHIWLNDDNASDDTFLKRRIQNSEKIITILVLHSKPRGLPKITVKTERTCCGLRADVLLEIPQDTRGLNFHNAKNTSFYPLSWNTKKKFYFVCDLLHFWMFLHKYYAPSADNWVHVNAA